MTQQTTDTKTSTKPKRDLPVYLTNPGKPPGYIKPFEKMTRKEQLFILNYIKTGNIVQSVKTAGYNSSSPHLYGQELMKRPHIAHEIQKRMEEFHSPLICEGREVLEYLSAVMRGEVKDQFGLETSVSERTRAAIELAKRTVDIENRMSETAANQITIKLDWGQNFTPNDTSDVVEEDDDDDYDEEYDEDETDNVD